MLEHLEHKQHTRTKYLHLNDQLSVRQKSYWDGMHCLLDVGYLFQNYYRRQTDWHQLKNKMENCAREDRYVPAYRDQICRGERRVLSHLWPLNHFRTRRWTHFRFCSLRVCSYAWAINWFADWLDLLIVAFTLEAANIGMMCRINYYMSLR